MEKVYLQPAASIIEKHGIDILAQITGKDKSRIYRWRLPKDVGGTGGSVPQDDAQKLLNYAKKHDGFDISPDEFFLSQSEVA